MKKTFLMLCVALPMMAMAQLVEVASIQKVNTPGNTFPRMAGISPDGSYLLITTQFTEGLQKIDIATGKSTILTTAMEAGFEAKISKDGKQVLYREQVMGTDQINRTKLMHIDVDTRATQEIVPVTRELGGYAIQENTVLAVNQLQMKRKVMRGAARAAAPANDVPVVSISEFQLMITQNGETRVLSPNGTDQSYIWASVSPDCTKVCYFLMSGGCWVANIDGSNPRMVNWNLHDAKWYTNDILIGMEDKDDGEVYTASTIVLQALDGTRQVLTDGQEIAMYPYASADGKRIVYSTEEGNAYVMNVK